MMMTTVEPGQRARHKRTGDLYLVWKVGLMKWGSTWHEAVIYESLEDPSKPPFCRTLAKFKRNFESA